MDDFASTALFNLIATRLQQLGMDAEPSKRFEGKTRRTAKSDLLSDALEALGASAIVAIGQGIHTLEGDPTLAVLARADSPAELMERWQRLERYYHGKHRVRILETGANSLRLEHYSTGATKPSAGEDLVVAGLIVALLQRIGCRALSLSIGDPTVRFMDQGSARAVRTAPGETAIWHLGWQCFEPLPTDVAARSRSGSSTERLSEVIVSDLGRNWRLGNAAQVLGTSTRSLQRALAREGTSFQQLLRTVRVERAAALISSSDCRLAEAGYACGFSDQAHFSRDFKLRFNMSPSRFAEIAAR